ncbi:MAG TPA: mechanosensitive ion channel family protein [Methanocella sp.]|nr:mechanosensitive ion channel family protein [Methanocella sp.]
MSDNSTVLLGTTAIGNIKHQIMLATGLSEVTTGILIAALILITSYIAAKAVKLIVSEIAPRLVSRTETTLDDEIVKAANGPLQILVFVLGAYIAIGALGSGLLGETNLWLNEILLIIVIFIVAYLLANLVSGVINWYKNDIAPKTESDFDDVFLPFIQKVLTVSIAILAILVGLEQFHIVEITPFITGLGIIGIALALAAKELLSSFFGSLAILTDRPYKVGDRVAIQGTETGDVVEIGLRSTRLRTVDNRLVIVPNLKVSNSRITNFAQPNSQVVFEINVGISYDADVDKAARIMKEVATSTKGVLTDPEPKVHVVELGDFAVKLLMLVYADDYKNIWVTPDGIYRQILSRFEAEGVEIPYPITNVIVKGGFSAPEHAAVEHRVSAAHLNRLQP